MNAPAVMGEQREQLAVGQQTQPKTDQQTAEQHSAQQQETMMHVQVNQTKPVMAEQQQPIAKTTVPPVRSLEAIRQKQQKPLRTASPLILSDANVDWDTLYPQVTAAIMQGSCNPSINAVKKKFQLDYRSAKSLLDELVCKGYLLASQQGYQLNPVEPSVQRSHQMCGGIAYENQQVFFPNPTAALPVRLKGGGPTAAVAESVAEWWLGAVGVDSGWEVAEVWATACVDSCAAVYGEGSAGWLALVSVGGGLGDSGVVGRNGGGAAGVCGHGHASAAVCPYP